jgi:hypothetical protein
MGMDGLYRPSQSLGYTDSLGHLNAADRAKELSRQVNQVNAQRDVDAVNPDAGDGKQDPDQRERPREDNAFAEALKDLFTREFNIEFLEDGQYHFAYNESTDRFELMDSQTGKILLALKPDEFIQVTENMRHQSGVITDRSA